MGLFNRYKFGSRVLRMGMRGPDVLKLQACLRERGYDIPHEETYFGYLTREALQEFQRDYRLAVDGVAGKTVFALLRQEKLPITRIIHNVAPGETIAEIAEEYGVEEASPLLTASTGFIPGSAWCFLIGVWAMARGSCRW